MSDRARLEELRKKQGELPRDAGVLDAVLSSTNERILGNVMGIPEFLARAGRGAQNIGRVAIGMEPKMIEGPLLGLPTGREARAGILGMLPGVDAEDEMARREIASAEHPVATNVGSVLGDAATIMATRAPIRQASGTSAGGLLDDAVESGLKRLAGKPAASKTGVEAASKAFLNSDVVHKVARAAGRSLETGLEGAFLTTLQEGDPVQVGMIAAGGQLASSAALTAAKNVAELPVKGIKAGPLASLVVNAGIAGGLLSLFQSVAPGSDNPTEAAESGYDKVAFSLLVGGAAGLMGKRGKSEFFPLFADAVWTAPRAALLNVAQEVSEALQASEQAGDDAAKVLSLLQTNPEALDPWKDKIRRPLESAEYSLVANVKRLRERDKKFADLLDAPDPRLAGVPLKKEL